MVLVGNKIDLVDQRVIKAETAKKLAEEWKCSYVECSAKKNENINQVFSELVRSLVQTRKTTGKSNSKPGGKKICIIL